MQALECSNALRRRYRFRWPSPCAHAARADEPGSEGSAGALAAKAREATAGAFTARVVRQPVAEAPSPSPSGWDSVAIGMRVAFC
jgi:hypothetical protein